MKKNELELYLLKSLRDKVGEECEVSAISVLKNNNTKLRAFRFVKKDTVLSPTIYLNQYYSMYDDGMDEESLAVRIFEDYKASVKDDVPDLSFFFEYEKMREPLMCKIINVSRNKEILKGIPYIPFLDLAIVFYCRVGLSDRQTGTVLIRNDHFNMWNVSTEDMYKDALENNRRILGISARPITEVMIDLLRMIYNVEAEDDDMVEIDDLPMYVLTNNSGLNGAACMLDCAFMEGFGEKIGGSFFILPSSVHEIIIIPENQAVSIDHLKDMVRLINKTEVPREEVLSDEVYLYDYSKKAVAFA